MSYHEPLFVTGPVRSGSTLLARLLSTNEEVMVASDPYLPLFRSLRNAIVRHKASPDLARNFDPDAALQDYYFTSDRIAVMDTVLAATLDIPFDESEWDTLLPGNYRAGQRRVT